MPDFKLILTITAIIMVTLTVISKQPVMMANNKYPLDWQGTHISCRRCNYFAENNGDYYTYICTECGYIFRVKDE